MNGIICDLSYTRHRSFATYYHTIKNLYGEPKIVKNIDDLNVDVLFIGDDHHQPHRDIWQAPGFIEKCNERDIKVIVFSNERIMDSYFPWNEDIYKDLVRFNNLHHFVPDADDMGKLGVATNRMCLSKSLYNENWRKQKKRNEIVFIGRTDCMLDSYHNRIMTLDKIKKNVKIITIEPVIERWEDYMSKLSEFRFVLCPLGNGNFLTLKFYEALMVGSIPVHQVKDNTLDCYPVERKLNDCIFFKNHRDMSVKIKNIRSNRSHSMIFQEDVIGEQLKNIL